jgi:hypothetical protein
MEASHPSMRPDSLNERLHIIFMDFNGVVVHPRIGPVAKAQVIAKCRIVVQPVDVTGGILSLNPDLIAGNRAKRDVGTKNPTRMMKTV